MLPAGLLLPRRLTSHVALCDPAVTLPNCASGWPITVPRRPTPTLILGSQKGESRMMPPRRGVFGCRVAES